MLKAKFSLVIVTVALIALVIVPISASHALQPQGCSQDPHGKTYAQLGTHVFTISEYQIMSEDGSHRMPAPPNPPLASDPIGCPGHPYATIKIGKMKLDKTTNSLNTALETMVDIQRINLFYQNADGFDREQEYDGICKRVGRRLNIGEHLKACSYGLPSEQDQKLGIGEHLLIKADDYKTPLDLPFFADCAFTSCHIQYGLYKDVLIEYRFVITDNASFAANFQKLQQEATSRRNPTASVPLEQIVAFDKIVRQRVMDAEIKD